jgi:hypothetical protein
MIRLNRTRRPAPLLSDTTFRTYSDRLFRIEHWRLGHGMSHWRGSNRQVMTECYDLAGEEIKAHMQDNF